MQAEYGKIEVGLYIAAFQDASKRAKVMDEEGKNESTEDDDDEGVYTDRPPTRNRFGRGGRGSRGGRGTSGAQGARGHSNGNKGGLRPPPRDAEKETQGRRVKGGEIDKALQLTGSRNIAAMFLRYGIYDSVSPACFYRTRPSLYTGAVAQSPPPSRGKLSYNADEYVTFALISEYESCATGVVHAAVLEVRAHEGQCLTRDAIVKLAFSTDQQERLLNEYRIYSLMAAKNVEEIPVVLGLYKDIEGEPSALVMTHEGTSLDDRGGSVTPAERVAFIQALKVIHAAGILHNDIRRRNLLVNETGEVAIIDFDQGTRNNSPTKQAQELAVLENVLAGL
ncbi:hypothetical protein DFH11DRAFT_84658 [Phellopilus nigrolimitatus]|nr:hypothetical protein DFH11DRAFT_84658 [Phellopilus nigrolimitatus]